MYIIKITNNNFPNRAIIAAWTNKTGKRKTIWDRIQRHQIQQKFDMPKAPFLHWWQEWLVLPNVPNGMFVSRRQHYTFQITETAVRECLHDDGVCQTVCACVYVCLSMCASASICVCSYVCALMWCAYLCVVPLSSTTLAAWLDFIHLVCSSD